jgi:hypothetical protein
LGYIGLQEANSQAGLSQVVLNSLSAFGSTGGERDICSGLSKESRRSLADSGASAGDQNHFPA